MARVTGVYAKDCHGFSKDAKDFIRLVAGFGVEGDAHAGAAVQHLHTARNHPLRVNLRQIHLVESELLDELREIGFEIDGGALGENISTRGIDLVSLPRATRLQIGGQAQVEVTGLRAPCIKIERYMRGLRIAASGNRHGKSYLKRSVMGVVVASGRVGADDQIRVSLPPPPHGSLGLV